MRQTAPRRGRPRPAETIERDESIYEILSTGARSRGQLAQQTGLTTDLVALALRRLQRAGRVRQCLQGGVIVWSVADATPCP
jgi:predicted Rossmann fold nucleotide-binding protein DprA/Smf involved in DNA uptake